MPRKQKKGAGPKAQQTVASDRARSTAVDHPSATQTHTAQSASVVPSSDTFTQVSNRSQVIDLHDHEDAYAHYSYDVVAREGGGANRKDNDHLTIENSLAALLATQRQDAEGLEPFREGRRTKTKADHNQLLNAYNFTSIDNLNFRTPDQSATDIGASDPTVDSRASGSQRKAADAESDAVAVEEDIGLKQFTDWLGAIFTKVGVEESLQKSILGSMESVQERMGVRAQDLKLNQTQKVEFAKFVILSGGLSGWAGSGGPIQVPDPLKQLVANPPAIHLKRKDYTPKDWTEKIPDDLSAQLQQHFSKKKSGPFKIREGESGFNQLQRALVHLHWNTIKQWVLEPPADV